MRREMYEQIVASYWKNREFRILSILGLLSVLLVYIPKAIKSESIFIEVSVILLRDAIPLVVAMLWPAVLGFMSFPISFCSASAGRWALSIGSSKHSWYLDCSMEGCPWFLP